MAACVDAATPAAAAAAAVRPTRNNSGRDAVGTTDDYQVTRRLGTGTFGAVFKARHRVTGETVAIKRLAAGDFYSERELLREVSLLEASSRDNKFVVGFYGLARDPATMDLCLVMEFVGPSLDGFLDQPPLPEAMVRAVMRQLLTGAKKMHAAGVVHRDIKPENILVGGGKAKAKGITVKICDFGLATMRMDASSSVAAAVVAPPPVDNNNNNNAGPEGTPGYMAPELLLGEDDCGAPVDAWALGCVMAELVMGQRLFPEQDLCRQLISVVHLLGIPDDVTLMSLGVSGPSKLREKVPEERLSSEGFDVLQGLLEYNPKDRLTAVAALNMPWFEGAEDD